MSRKMVHTWRCTARSFFMQSAGLYESTEQPAKSISGTDPVAASPSPSDPSPHTAQHLMPGARLPSLRLINPPRARPIARSRSGGRFAIFQRRSRCAVGHEENPESPPSDKGQVAAWTRSSNECRERRRPCNASLTGGWRALSRRIPLPRRECSPPKRTHFWTGLFRQKDSDTPAPYVLLVSEDKRKIS